MDTRSATDPETLGACMNKREKELIRLSVEQLVEGLWETPMKTLCSLAGLRYPAIEEDVVPVRVEEIRARLLCKHCGHSATYHANISGCIGEVGECKCRSGRISIEKKATKIE